MNNIDKKVNEYIERATDTFRTSTNGNIIVIEALNKTLKNIIDRHNNNKAIKIIKKR